jgi:hypothetical protein
VYKLKNADFANLAIKRAAVRALLMFPTLFIYPLAYLGSSEVVEIRTPQLLQKCLSVRFLE